MLRNKILTLIKSLMSLSCSWVWYTLKHSFYQQNYFLIIILFIESLKRMKLYKNKIFNKIEIGSL